MIFMKNCYIHFIGIQSNSKALNQPCRIFSGAYSLVWYCLLEDNGSQF